MFVSVVLIAVGRRYPREMTCRESECEAAPKSALSWYTRGHWTGRAPPDFAEKLGQCSAIPRSTRTESRYLANLTECWATNELACCMQGSQAI